MRGLLICAAGVAAIAACASAGSATGDKPADANKAGDAAADDKHDAPGGRPVDAPGVTQHDAPGAPDARPIDAPPPPPDASTDGNVCSMNSQCTDAGECCITLGGSIGFCGPGTPIGNACLPN